MQRFFIIAVLLFLSATSAGQQESIYRSLDTKTPVDFRGDYFFFKGKKIVLGPNAFFVDGQLSDSVAGRYPFVFNSMQKAAAKLSNGTETEPMIVYLAPWVYWIDDPDDTAVRVPVQGTTPYGMEIQCNWLKFEGLTDDPRNVVLASNRGQTIGAKGNFTMFRFAGDGTGSTNLTFGNYCNVDLEFPLKPSLNRRKRASAIVQAQLIHCNGDKIVARNTRFISRLNLCPFVGGKRVLFDSCHFESTDDALCGTGVYLNSTLDFYSSKPFYNTTGTGAVFLNCRIRSFAGSKQYFTKAGGQVVVIDAKLSGTSTTYWGWQDVATKDSRNYQAGILINGKPSGIGKTDPSFTVEIGNKNLVHAYKFQLKGKTYYNTYNLLRGDDDWDPMQIKSAVSAAEAQSGTLLKDLAVRMRLSPVTAAIETNKDVVILRAESFRFGNYPSGTERLQWSVPVSQQALVTLQPAADGRSCTVVPRNLRDTTVIVVITASTPAGLEAAAVLKVAPAMLKAPEFASAPKLFVNSNGVMQVHYKLNTDLADRSDIRWFRCKDSSGNDAIETAVSREGKPLREYALTQADIGYRIMVSVSPRHIRSTSGNAVTALFERRVAADEVKLNRLKLKTDFSNFSTANQVKVIPGFFTLANPADPSKPAWYYGEGQDGAANMTGLLQARDAALYYTPLEAQRGDMEMTLQLAPFKTAGQGFSVAHLYMDVLIGFDAETKTGYGLRLIRTIKYGDALDCFFVRYDRGKATPISEPVGTTAFRSICTINLKLRGSQLYAEVTTSAREKTTSGLPAKLKISRQVSTAAAGGFGIEYHGGSPTMIKALQVNWQP